MENTNLNLNRYGEATILHQPIEQKEHAPLMIEYKGVQIVYIDFSEIKKPEELYAAMSTASAFIKKHLPKSLYTLTNLSGMHFNNEIFNHMTNYAKENSPYVRASAVVGMTGMMQIFYNTFTRMSGREIKAFSSIEDAKEYLISR